MYRSDDGIDMDTGEMLAGVLWDLLGRLTVLFQYMTVALVRRLPVIWTGAGSLNRREKRR